MKKLTLKKTTLSRLNNERLSEVKGGNLTRHCGPVDELPDPQTMADRPNYNGCIAVTSDCIFTNVECP